jgi:hypothetical protein
MRLRVGLTFATLASIVAAGCVGDEASFAALNSDKLNYRPAGPANEVMVLASPHLSQLPDSFDPQMVEPLVIRLTAWSPAAVASENISGVVCDFMRRNPARYIEAYEYYCFNPSIAGNATGLDVPAANSEAESMLANWPLEPEPVLRRRLAAVFLAAGEPASALVQWLRLPREERIADGALTPELVDLLNTRIFNQNETELIAAKVAAMAGLERVWSVDDQTPYMGPLDDPDAYGAALSAAWDNPATKARSAQSEALEAELDQADGLLKYYRALNDPSYAEEAYASDWGPALAEPSLEAYGRRYVAYWEARNLRMVANIREVLGRQPGTRMLVVVGASHKGYYEAYLGQMRDVEIIDIMPLLQ